MDYGFQRYGTELDSKQRRVADEYVRLCGYKHGEIGGDHNQRCQNGTSEKLTLDERSDIHMGEQKEKKIIFSEEIDSSITGIALGASFVALAILVWKFEMFHNHTVNSVVQIVLLIIGILGTAVEFDKINKNDIKGIDDLSVRFAKCCSPIPGDEIVGFISRGRGVTVHRKDCKSIKSLEESRIMPLSWDNNQEETTYVAKLRLIVKDASGSLANIINKISEQKLNIAKIDSKALKMGPAIVNLSVFITNTKKLDELILKLQSLENVIEIFRGDN